MKIWIKLIIALIILAGLLFAGYVFLGLKINSNTPDPILEIYCLEDVYNCGDYDNQEDAQQVYDSCMQEVGYDIHQLDNDGDGIACEGLK